MTAVPVTRLTVISADPFDDQAAAARWLDDLRGDADALEDVVGEGLVTANGALHAHAVSSQDPALTQISRSAPLAVRVGYGSGEELADGRWTGAVDVPPPSRRARRTEALRPSERLASVLGGHERADVCETLLLRARADLDAGRRREAALQLRIGLDALLAEIDAGDEGDQAADLEAVHERRPSIAAVADAALAGEPTDAEADEVEATLAICERVLRRRRILGS
jgi:hypothetical protein